MKPRMTWILSVVLLLVVALPGFSAEPDEGRAAAIAAIKKLGGRVKVDKRSPNLDVTSVSLSGAKVNDEVLKHVKVLTNLERLRLRHTKITDAGLKNLEGLTKLKFLALGNHEGEQGWRLDGTPDNLAVWATLARQLLYPNPFPDTFYSGNSTVLPFVGLRENYYAWQWGDALFVVLDPYWNTTLKPHSRGPDPATGDRWDWTLGFEQYDWMRQVLQGSTATFKFVFAHQVAVTNNISSQNG